MSQKRRMGVNQKRWLLSLHLLFSSVWIGAMGVLLLIAFLYRAPEDDSQVKTVYGIFKIIDDFLIIPSCFGSLGTGFCLSLWTNWGFFVYWWVLWKWVCTVAMIGFGALFLGRWVNELAARSALGGAALEEPLFQSYAAYSEIFISLQLVMLLSLIVISIFKPWGKRGGKRPGG